MSLNIKNERVHELIRVAAARTGQTQTSVVEAALRRYLDELDRGSKGDELDEIAARMQRGWRESTAAPFSAEDLYDAETGLPA